MSLPSVDENALDDLYKWLSTVPLSKKIKNIARDLSDGVLVAEIVAHFLPRYVNLSNFTPVNSKALKRYNWETLNKMTFAHLDFIVNQNLIQRIITCQAGAIEFVLLRLREKLEQALQEGRFKPNKRRSRSSVVRAGSNISLQETDSDTEIMMLTSIHDEALRKHISPKSAVGSHNYRYGNEVTILMQKYHQCQQELLAKDERMQKLYARIRHLERLSQLKDDRIDELTKHLDKITRVRYKEQHNVLGMPCPMNHHKDIDTPPGSSDDQSFMTSNSLSPRETNEEQTSSFIDLK